ncbi:MAG: hypothetical protein ABSC08_19000 [Bryobacteraceae bacterium]
MREPAALPALEYPLPAVERVAVVGTRLGAEPGVRSFPHWSTPDLEGWKPQALAGRRSELFAIGALRRQGYLALPELRFPLVVLSSLPEGPLSPEQHERLWSLFELPVYEQIRGADETLLGWECDARDGWHLACEENGSPKLALGEVRAAGWQGAQLRGFCGCGKTCLRLIAEPTARHRAASAAAGCSAHSGGGLMYAS